MGVMNVITCGKNSKNRYEDEAEMMKKTIKGTVVLMKKNTLDLNDIGASLLDRVYEIFGKHVSVQLISSTRCDPC